MKRRRRTRPPHTARSLASSQGFETFVLDQLVDLGDVLPRRMFGGIGLYCRGLFFGIIARDTLFLKVDAETRATYEAAACSPFRPYPDRPGTMGYFAVPVEVLESAPELVRWARAACGAAERSATAKRR